MTQVVGSGASLIERVQRVIEEDKVRLPPLPAVTLRLQKILNNDSADAGQVSELLRNEPALTVALLRFANSAAFGGLRKITDLRQAVARLGLKQVASLVTALKLREQFSSNTTEKAQALHHLWDHSVCTAILARNIARHVDGDVEAAFLGGLLHDCGRLLILRAADYLENEDPGLVVTAAVVEDLAQAAHAQLGGKSLRAWEMPEELCIVAERHEDEDGDSNNPLLTIVQAAITLTRKLGMHPHPDDELNPMDEPAVERLGMQDIELATMLVDAEDEFDEVRGLFR